MIALLNPSKEGSNQYFNSLNENNRENRFKSEKFVSNNSEDGQKNSVCFDNKFLNLIEEMENLEVSIKNNNAKLNLFENSSSTSQILKSLNQIEKDVDNINLLSMKFSPQKITEIPKKSNEIKRTKQHSTIIENNTEKVFKKKMNMLEELKKLNYNYD